MLHMQKTCASIYNITFLRQRFLKLEDAEKIRYRGVFLDFAHSAAVSAFKKLYRLIGVLVLQQTFDRATGM